MHINDFAVYTQKYHWILILHYFFPSFFFAFKIALFCSQKVWTSKHLNHSFIIYLCPLFADFFSCFLLLLYSHKLKSRTTFKLLYFSFLLFFSKQNFNIKKETIIGIIDFQIDWKLSLKKGLQVLFLRKLVEIFR